MKIDLKNPRQNAFAAQLIAGYLWTGDFDFAFENYIQADDNEEMKTYKEEWGINSLKDLEAFINENTEILEDGSLLTCKIPI